MNEHDRKLEAAEKATLAAKKGATITKIRRIEEKYDVDLNIYNHIDGFSFTGVNDWGQLETINVYE